VSAKKRMSTMHLRRQPQRGPCRGALGYGRWLTSRITVAKGLSADDCYVGSNRILPCIPREEKAWTKFLFS
jgi:hypothetical protein